MPEEAPARNLRLLTEEELHERRHILLDGIAQFNDGYFFESHETWEDLWLPSPWPVRDFLQGVIQIAAGLVHFVRGEYPGTVSLIGAGLAKIEAFREGCLGVDVAALIDDTRRALDEIEALGPERFRDWDRRRAPRIVVADP